MDTNVPSVNAASARAEARPANYGTKRSDEVRAAVKATDPLAPWEREKMLIWEVPVYIKHKYNVNVSYSTVVRWTRKGKCRRDQKLASDGMIQMVVLPREMIMNRTYIRRDHLEEFLAAT